MHGQFASQSEVLAISPVAAISADGNSTGVDITKYEGLMAIVLDSAAGSGTAPTLDVKLQHSDAIGGTYTDVAGAAFAQVSGTASRQKIVVNSQDLLPFIRVARDVGGTTPSFTMSVVALALPKYG
jgi:hypothetical protein